MTNRIRRKNNPKVNTDILLRSGRRCCLCFGLKNDHTEKKGQIAHLDHDPSNNEPDNLAFLCLDHHDEYDSKTSQSKSLQLIEVKAYRENLYQFLYTNQPMNRKDFEEQGKEGTSTKRVSARALNIFLSEKPHKCSYCGYSFSIMPEIEEGKSYFVKTAVCPQCGNKDEVSKFYQIDNRIKAGEKDDRDKIFTYLDILYNETGLFVKQYYDSDDSHNSQKSRSLHKRMEEFVSILGPYKLSLSDKLITEITAFFDMLVSYKSRVEGAVSYKRDETAYKRWLEINTEFGKKVVPMFEGLKNAFKKT